MNLPQRFSRTFERRRRFPSWLKFLAIGVAVWLFIIFFAVAYIGEDKYNRRKRIG